MKTNLFIIITPRSKFTRQSYFR